jgi:hypothetical protein
MLLNRPCGVCAALVPAATGCRHWHPDKPPALRGKSAAYAENKRRKQAVRAAEMRAKARAKQNVDEFRQTMTSQGGRHVAQVVGEDPPVQHPH